MPGFDGTGPLGLGPMTGRGMGYCVMPLSQAERDGVQFGYAGISGIKVPITSSYAFGNPYLSGLGSRLPFWKPCFRRGFGRGGGSDLGRGWFRFGRGPFGWC
jgi:hypothetical protein